MLASTDIPTSSPGRVSQHERKKKENTVIRIVGIATILVVIIYIYLSIAKPDRPFSTSAVTQTAVLIPQVCPEVKREKGGYKKRRQARKKTQQQRRMHASCPPEKEKKRRDKGNNREARQLPRGGYILKERTSIHWGHDQHYRRIQRRQAHPPIHPGPSPSPRSSSSSNPSPNQSI